MLIVASCPYFLHVVCKFVGFLTIVAASEKSESRVVQLVRNQIGVDVCPNGSRFFFYFLTKKKSEKFSIFLSTLFYKVDNQFRILLH